MICLHCGQPLKTKAEKDTEWHAHCIKDFFGTTILPELKVTKKSLENLASLSVDKGYTIPGVQKKISLHLETGRNARLTLIDYPAGYIMKPQTEEYKHLPEYEFLAMLIAKASGISTVHFALYHANNQYVYLTKRIDRQGDKRLAMEDFCQLNGRLSEDKYKGSYEACVRTVRQYSKARNLDLTEIFTRLVLSFLIGNSDMHLKNFSLIESAPGARDFRLSPAYDILPVNVIEKDDPDELALSLNGKTRHLTRADFLKFATYAGIPDKVATRLITRLLDSIHAIETTIKHSFLTKSEKSHLLSLLSSRVAILSN